MKRWHISAVILVLVMVLLVGCSSSTTAKTSSGLSSASGANASETNKKIVIGFDAFSDSVDFSHKIHQNLQAEADKAGAKLLYAESNGDATTALKNVNAFLSQGATVIVESAWATGAVQAVADLCESKGIPCISIDIPVSNAYFMGVNNAAAGQVAGKAALDYVQKNWGGKVDDIVIEFPTVNGPEVKKRVEGVPLAFSAANIKVPNVVWFDPGSSDATIASKQLATDFLTAHPNDKHIVFVTTNDQGAQGVLSAIQTSHRDSDCIIVSHGADVPAITNLRGPENSWIGSVGYFPEKYGTTIINMITQLSEGKTIPKETYITNVFIDKSNIDQYYPK